jgi:two-component system, chemotaxis family, chemotaxis protein CheY
MPAHAVLVVDDDLSILVTVAELLTLEGYVVQTATNGKEALHEMEQRCPVLVLLDMRMPVMDGWEFARRVRQRSCQPRILVMTAAQDAKKWADEIHADGHLDKPFDILDLLTTVERLCA